MYSYIRDKKTIVFLSKEKFDLSKEDLKIECENNVVKCNSINEIREYIKGEWYYNYTFNLEEIIDITKVYCISLKDDVVFTDVKQYYKTSEFEKDYYYDGNDLGVTLKNDSTTFKVWSPVASKITVKVFEDDKTEQFETFQMEKGDKGIFVRKISKNLKGHYYTYEVECFNKTNEAVDIYAKAVGTNGLRGMIIDLEDTNPVGFVDHSFENPKSITETIIYEVHVRDLSMDENSGIKQKGKFLGFTERDTVNSFGQSTGIDHIVELGATHVHLLPSFDYKSIDESTLDKNDFNWGYDPQNYNVPEGSYSTNPEDGIVRIKEMKTAIKAMHKAGLGVIMDVVYNHTYDTNISNHEKIVPGYYYRCDEFGNLTNGSACSNETASERIMVAKHFIDSVVYWAKEYKIDGFRFDLMGLHDVDTMNEIRYALDNVNKNIIIYGEGWCGGPTPLDEGSQALKKNANKTDKRIAYFSDDIRDGVKGDVFVDETPGFVNGGENSLEDVKFGIVGSVKHKQINIDDVKYSDDFWAIEPTQTVSYVSAHDNLTLYDKFIKTCPKATKDELIQMNKLSAFITHISQGALFFQAGEEFGRTKNGDENSYKSPDSVNKIRWDRKNEYLDLYNYYKGLIELRKSDKVFTLESTREINKRIEFGECSAQFLAVHYKAKSKKYSEYVALVNAQNIEQTYKLKNNVKYVVLVDGKVSGTTPISEVYEEIVVPPKTAIMLGKEEKKIQEQGVEFVKENKKPLAIGAGVLIATFAIAKTASAIIKKKKK